MEADPRRTYLVVVDDSAEARVALRFAARRAAKTGGRIEVLGIVEPQDFVQFGGVQAAIEEEQRLRIEGVKRRERRPVPEGVARIGRGFGSRLGCLRFRLGFEVREHAMSSVLFGAFLGRAATACGKFQLTAS